MRAGRGLTSRQWELLRREALARDGYQCVQCPSVVGLEVDHVRPKHAGGSDALSNLQTLCRDCHLAKTRTEQPRRLRRNPAAARWQSFTEELTYDPQATA